MTAEKKMLTQLREIDRLDKLYMALIDTDEDASDKAYEQMWNLVDEVATLIVKSTSGRITETVAKRMIFHKRPQLIALCKRFA